MKKSFFSAILNSINKEEEMLLVLWFFLGICGFFWSIKPLREANIVCTAGQYFVAFVALTIIGPVSLLFARDLRRGRRLYHR